MTYSGSLWRWSRRARWVGWGRDCVSTGGERERLLGTGMVEAPGRMELEDDMLCRLASWNMR